VALTLVIGNRNYSSWSLRAWLLLRHYGIDFDEVRLSLDTPGFPEQVARWSPAGRVPVLIDGDVSIWDSMAIAEYVNEGLLGGRGWPKTLAKRALARSITAEMHSGFAALRSEMPMNVRRHCSSVVLSDAALQDVIRVQAIWDQCLARDSGPWLFGDFSIADAFYAPVALRFATYKVALTPLSAEYQARMLADPAVQEWCLAAKSETEVVAADER
jgi:glutathione S-transferase